MRFSELNNEISLSVLSSWLGCVVIREEEQLAKVSHIAFFDLHAAAEAVNNKQLYHFSHKSSLTENVHRCQLIRFAAALLPAKPSSVIKGVISGEALGRVSSPVYPA